MPTRRLLSQEGRLDARRDEPEPIELEDRTNHHNHFNLPILAREQTFWTKNIALSVPLPTCRDHLANERVFLAYLRTASTLSSFGVAITQFFRLKHSQPVAGKVGYFEIGVPLASVIHCLSVALVLLGLVRFFRSQRSMTSGQAISGGWEIVTATVIAGLVGEPWKVAATFLIILADASRAVHLDCGHQY